MRIYRVLVLLLVALAVAGCAVNQPAVELIGSGRVVSKEMRFTDFDRVRATRFFHVTVQVGDRYAVSVEADDNLFEHISVTQQGSELIFGLQPGRLGVPRPYTWRSGTLEATVTLPRLAGATASENGQITIPTCRVEDLELTATGNGALRASIEGGDVRVSGDGNSFTRLAGSAQSLRVNGDGNSNLDLTELEAGSARVELDGLAQATVEVRDRLDYDVAGLAHLTYLGGPQIGEGRTAGNARVIGR